MENLNYPFVNLPLPYSYDALEPYIDEQTMHLHHDKHLQTYIDNLNKILKDYPWLQKMNLEQLVRGRFKLPQDKYIQLHNNAGGVYNHRFFFDGLSPQSEKEPVGNLTNAINDSFGNFYNLKEEFKKAALSVFGSGYAWLVCRNKSRKLEIVTTHNQGSPIEMCLNPILTIDVWEHAYYLKYHNVRAEYIDNWFNVIDWSKADTNYG